jgi:hypothetical protein
LLSIAPFHRQAINSSNAWAARSSNIALAKPMNGTAFVPSALFLGSDSQGCPRPRRSCAPGIFDRGTLPRFSTPRVTAVLATPANHNCPADHLPEARVAASCTPPSDPLQNQDDRVFAHYGKPAVTERQLRQVLKTVVWSEQRERWAAIRKVH